MNTVVLIEIAWIVASIKGLIQTDPIFRSEKVRRLLLHYPLGLGGKSLEKMQLRRM